MEAAVMEVADTEAAVTLVGATSAAVISAEAAPMYTLAGPMCMSAGPMIASPEAATSGIAAAVGLAGIGVMADSVMADPMPPATRTGALIRTAIGRNELKLMGVLNVHLASYESLCLVISSLTDDGRVICVALRDHHELGRQRSAPCAADVAVALPRSVLNRSASRSTLEFDRLITAWHRSNQTSNRLHCIPRVGPLLATATRRAIAMIPFDRPSIGSSRRRQSPVMAERRARTVKSLPAL
jgi:hypothetical protein